MDKQTLSNYGWLVIVTLILAVMLAFATPFGTYVGDGVVSIANSFVGASDQAIDEDNIKTNGEKWDSKFDYSGFNNSSPHAEFNSYWDEASQSAISGKFILTWDELKLKESSDKYGHDYGEISNTSVGDYAFDTCSNLTKIILPEGISSIYEYAFYGCNSLTTISIPSTVTYIDVSAFDGCTSLTNIKFGGTMEQWRSIPNSCDSWIDCQEISVTCTNGTITIDAYL